ncbi:hypothetical protein RHMOL_Rhmol01G0017300 [Rhododendron molle]|uniref:Uncharacterized protein n=1 Tax=Rhododendron molle TaxID=49168 RepID=A0ACC0PZX9_RHOML|nr:hypothetical protein RHMOL_Rhmol01G0017300 [Rhododendron molle]
MARKASNKRRKVITRGGSPSGISPAAELISGNVDLLTEIFLRLPAKSLIRFKSLSKHWLSLVSHPQFSAKHSSRNPRPSISGLYFYHRSSLESLSLHGRKNLLSIPFVDGPEGTGSIPRIRNSCNGLLLCEIDSFKARSFPSMEFKILKLESDTCDWIARYWVNLETIGSAFPEMEALFKFCVLCVVKGEMKEDYAVVLAIPGKVISYNLKCSKLDVLRVQGELTDFDVDGCEAYAYPFVESLSPV